MDRSKLATWVKIGGIGFAAGALLMSDPIVSIGLFIAAIGMSLE